jgi:hypothetical protein
MPTRTKSSSLKRYVTLCDGDVRDALEKKLLMCRGLVDKAQTQLDQAIAALEKAQHVADLAVYESVDHESEFTSILQHPDVRKVRVNEHSIVVKTGPISISYRGRTYKMGTYRIRIKTDANDYPWQTGEIEALFDIASITGSGHPHVSYGSPCFGNISASMTRLMRSRKYPAVIVLCIEFLKSYTLDRSHAPYVKIDNWETRLQEAD